MEAGRKATVKKRRTKTKPPGDQNIEDINVLVALRESEEKFLAAFHATPTALVIARIPDNTFEYVNESFLNLHGYQRDEVLGRSLAELNLFADPDEPARIKKLLVETKNIRNRNVSIRSKNGEIKHVLFSVDIIQLNQQPHSLTTIMDITERVQAEKQVVQMKRLYATLSQVNQTIVRVKDREELYQSICDVAVQFGEFALVWIGLLDEETGDVKPVAANGLDLTQWPFPIINIRQGVLQDGLIATAIRTSQVITSDDMQTDERTSDLYPQFQHLGYLASAAIPLRLKGRTLGALSLTASQTGLFKAEDEMHLLNEMGLDISFALEAMNTDAERKDTEEKLLASEARYRRLFEAAKDGILILNADTGRIEDVNPFLMKILGYSYIEFLGKELWEIGLFKDIVANKDAFLGLQEQRYIRYENLPLKAKDGQIIWVEFVSNVYEVNGGQVVQCNIRDMTDRKRAEDALHASEERYRQLLEFSPDAIIVHSEGKFVFVNPAALRIYGATNSDELIGKPMLERIHPDFHDLVRERLQRLSKGQGVDLLEEKFVQLDGAVIDVEVAAIPLNYQGKPAVLVIARDITERKQAEEKILSGSRFPSENPNPILRSTEDGILLYANPSSQPLLKLWMCTVGMQLPSHLREIIAEVAQAGVSKEVEVDCDDRIFSFIFAPIAGAGYVNGYGRDVTSHKQAEEALHKSEARYRSLVENQSEAISRSDITGLLTYVNDAYCQAFGKTREELLGQVFTTLVFPEDLHIALEALKTIGKPPYRGHTETRHFTPQGLRWFEWESSAILNKAGEVIEFQGVGRDVTQRKQADVQIQQQLKYLNALRIIDVAISSSFDLRVTLDVILQQVHAQLNVDAAAVLLFDPEMKTIAYAAGRGFRTQVLHQAHFKLSEGYAGRAVRERKTIHVPALSQTDSKLAEVLQAAKEGFVEYYGTPLISKDGIKGVLEIYQRTPLNPDAQWFDFLETLAGQTAIAIDNAQLFDSLQRSNTELEQRVVHRTAELNQTNLELEHANRAKDEFLATMSHELRTPLNSILGLSETLLEQRRDPLSQQQQKSLQTIAASGEHLLSLINDILDLSKIEAGKFDYYPQLVGVDDLCRSSLTFVKEQATRKSITLTYQLETTVSKMYADPRRIKQVLVNLLTNAVKFTSEHGQVLLQVRSTMEQDRIQFSVIDSGIGIALADLKQLFVPFAQVDSSLTREYEGTGLGLALVHKLTDLHGGSVDVESEVGKGSRFTINLPLGQAMLEQPTASESGGKLPVGERMEKTDTSTATLAEREVILLAEDNMANIMTIGDYLESQGYQIVIAHDGLEALQKADEFQPKLILMDIQMPVLDGLEAIRRLRALPRFTATPIIALTALAMTNDRELCLEAGANEYMSKPVGLKLLAKTIQQLLSSKP